MDTNIVLKSIHQPKGKNMNKENRPYRLSIRVSDNEMNRLTQIKRELGYEEHTALFLVKLALDIYDDEVEDQWKAKHKARQD